MTVYERNDLPPDIAWFIVFGLTIALVASAAVAFVRALSRRRMAAVAAAQASDTPPPLVEGRDVMLAGVVQHFEGHEVAVKVTITQSGDETESSGSWSHSWTEIDREIVVAPFLLELVTGERVLVSPPKNVEVADALDQKVWIDRNKRVLSAELVPGEKIYARGRLERSDQAVAGSAYRDNSWGWALGPTSGGQMLLSSEPLGEGMAKRAAFHTQSAVITLAFFVGIQLSLFGFWDRMIGHTELATVTDKKDWVSVDSDGDESDHYQFTLHGGHADVSEGDYKFISVGEQLPVRYGSGNNWELGRDATIAWWHALFIVPIGMFALLLYRLRRKGTRPWFRRKVNEGGSGKLPDPPKRR